MRIKIAALLLSLVALAGCTPQADCAPAPDPFNQRAFPCQEDEVLGYAPRFGPDKVGCIHIDDLPEHLADLSNG